METGVPTASGFTHLWYLGSTSGADRQSVCGTNRQKQFYARNCEIVQRRVGRLTAATFGTWHTLRPAAKLDSRRPHFMRARGYTFQTRQCRDWKTVVCGAWVCRRNNNESSAGAWGCGTTCLSLALCILCCPRSVASCPAPPRSISSCSVPRLIPPRAPSHLAPRSISSALRSIK